MTVIYGIKACDTMKKAFVWLQSHGIEHQFHDFKKTPPSRDLVERWCDAAGWEKVLNRAGTTFRKLPDESKRDLDRAKAIELMIAQPSMIKRPVLETGTMIEIGFKPETYAQAFGK